MNNMDMNWKKIAMSFLLAAGLPLARNAQAQTTYEEKIGEHTSELRHTDSSRMPSSA